MGKANIVYKKNIELSNEFVKGNLKNLKDIAFLIQTAYLQLQLALLVFQ